MGSTRRALLKAGLAFPAARAAAAQDVLTAAATGDPIVHPWQSLARGFARIPEGKFLMGERESAHEVWLDVFLLAKYLVTNAEYKTFTDDTGQRPPRYWRGGAYPEGKANHPVLWVSWHDAQSYCAWMSRGAGRRISLPTEAQWEKAARGPEGFLYPWGNDRNRDNLNYNGVCARRYGLAAGPDGRVTGWREFTESAQYRDLVAQGGYTTPVGAFPGGRSAYGCYDMAGNAWQWCLDWYKADYYHLPGAARNPQGPRLEEADEVNRAGEHGKCKVIRGGSWYAQFTSARSVNREETRRPESGYHSVGFRVAAAG